MFYVSLTVACCRVINRFGALQSVGAKLLAPGQETGAVRVAVPRPGAAWPHSVVAERALLGCSGVRRLVLEEFEHFRFVRTPEPAGIHHATPSVRHIAASPTALAIRQRVALAVAQRRLHAVIRPPCLV